MQPPVPVLSTVTYPPGAKTTDARIVIDGVRGAIFEYKAGPPASSLVSSWASKAGTDPFGTGYPQGFSAGPGSVITGSTIIVYGSNGGVFMYSGTPAANNLVLADVAVNTTDPYGNQIFAGLNILTPFTAGQARLLNIAGGPGQSAGIQWYFSTVGQNTWQTGPGIGPQAATQLTVATDALSFLSATGGGNNRVIIQATHGFQFQNIIYVFPSGDTTGATDGVNITAAVAALPATGGQVVLGPGHYYMTTTNNLSITAAKPVWIMAHGAFISAVGALGGDLISWFDATNPVGRSYFGGGWIGGIIDGNTAPAGVTAMHFGDVEAAVMRDLTIQNFPTGQSLRLDNANWWTEEADMRVVIVNCPGPTFEVTGGFRSFGYGNFDFTIISNTGLNGVQILNGAFLYHGSLRMRGNFFGNSVAVSNFAFGMSGATPGSNTHNPGATSLMQAMRFEMQLECATAAFTPKAIVMDTVNFAFANELYGIIDLANGSGTFAHSTIATGQFSFTGMVNSNGDTALSALNGLWGNINAPVIYRNIGQFFQATFPTPIADMFSIVLGGNWTVALTAAGINGNQTLGQPQRITIRVQQSAAGGNTLTWPHPGAPTLANPIVKWPGGVPPVMTAAANAVDYYNLETIDGIEWYGYSRQNVS